MTDNEFYKKPATVSSVEKKTRKYGAVIIAVFIILIVGILAAAIIASTTKTELHPKDEIRANMDLEPFDKNTVASYLKKWEMPTFDRTILDAVEQVFETYYYMDMPEEREIARDTANIFLDNYYDKTDLGDQHKVAIALVDSMISAIGDVYSYYRSASETEDYRTDMSGSFAGIGVNV